MLQLGRAVCLSAGLAVCPAVRVLGPCVLGGRLPVVLAPCEGSIVEPSVSPFTSVEFCSVYVFERPQQV